MNSAEESPQERAKVRDAAAWHARLQESDATEQDFQEWQTWLASSPEHKRMFREVEDAWYLIGCVDPSLHASELESAASRRSESSGARRFRTSSALLAVAVVSVVAIGLALMQFEVPWGASRYATAKSEQRSVRLPDGTRITLGGESRLQSRFTDHSREITLAYGEAFFEVAQDPARPFVVRIRGTEIHALGTAFNVRAASDRVLVSVTEGRVALIPAEPDARGSPAVRAAEEGRAILHAGQQVALDRSGQIAQSNKAPADMATWRQGRFEYRGEELGRVVEDLNRYSDRRITLEDAGVSKLRYSGTIFPDHIDEWLEGVEGILPVAVVRQSDRSVLIVTAASTAHTR